MHELNQLPVAEGPIQHIAPRAFRSCCVVLALSFLFPALGRAQSPTPFALTAANPRRVQLSEPVHVEMAVFGPAPLRVEMPRQLLSPETERNWKIQPDGAPLLFPLPGFPGWECRIARYRLDPYVTGNGLPVIFDAVKVNGAEVLPPAFEVTVLTSVTEPSPESARPITGIEPAPSRPPAQSSSGWWWIPAVLGTLVIAGLAWRFRRRTRPVPPDEWARLAFDRLEVEHGEALVEGVAGVVRGYVERRFGIPATRLTTAEVLVAAEQTGWPVEIADALRRLLEVCDRAKFAGDVPDDDGRRDLLARGRDWLNQVSALARPG